MMSDSNRPLLPHGDYGHLRTGFPECKGTQAAKLLDRSDVPDTSDNHTRILVVDDDDDVRFGTMRLLGKAGYIVDQAADGEAALLSIRQRRPDLILLDRAMPGLDGLEVCRRIRQDPASADIVIILISGAYTESSQQAEGLEFGADGYIAKPITNRELLARVQAHFRILCLARTLQSKGKELEMANGAAGQGTLDALIIIEDAVVARDQMNATNQQLRQVFKERQRMEVYRAMGVEVLQILNEPNDFSDTIQRVIATVKMRTGFDAVGLRLQDGEDFPYYAQDGFSMKFLLTENTLIERGQDGGVCRDKDGHACLECTCGLVISGKTDPANPLFTRGGSCWTNDSFPLLDLPADQDPRLHPRNQCIHDGYASVALVPIREKDRIVGLLHLNDRRKDRFTLESVELLEGIVAHIGSALMRKQAEDVRENLQEQLQQAQKMEAVGRLAGGVAHDFNNLLMGIMGYTDLCRDQIAPDHPVREYLDEIMISSQRSAEITRQLLAFARKQVIAPKILNFNDAVAGIFKLLRRLIGENIKLIWRPGTSLRPVRLDPSQVDQILANLCVNARDAINGVGEIILETGSITVDEEFCARHPEANRGTYVFLAVSDDGCGMDTETLANIFEPFFTTKGVNKGTGLGLATVYGIVKQNNGFIYVYSEPNKGTTFKVYLPQIVAETEATTVDSKAKAPRGRGEIILLVEDEKSLGVICRRFLESLGYKVLLAETPEEALNMTARHPGDIHVLLTDVVMPGMDGRQLAQRISTVKPGVKELFMSGYTADVIAQRGVLGEGVQFISKPFTRDDLAHKIRETLEAD